MKSNTKKDLAAQGKREASRRCIIKKKAVEANMTVEAYVKEKFHTTLENYVTDEFQLNHRKNVFLSTSHELHLTPKSLAAANHDHIIPQVKYYIVCYPNKNTGSSFVNSPRVEISLNSPKEAISAATQFATKNLGGIQNFGSGQVYTSDRKLVANVKVNPKNKKKLYVVNTK